MKNDKKILNIIESALMLFLLCFIIFPQVFTKTIIAIILLVFMVITNKTIISYKDKGKYNKKITNLMIAIGIIYLILIYILGIYVSFYEAPIKLTIKTIFKYILPYIVIIISIENIRKTILLKDSKKSRIIIFVIAVMIDVILASNINSESSLKDYFELITYTVLPSIASNILYTYMILNYRNSKSIIWYRIITTIYRFIIPIIPDIHVLFESIIRLVTPFIIYQILVLLYNKKEKHIATKTKTRDIIITSIIVSMAVLLIMLVSCQFKYAMIVIGSGSMTGTINKADAIIYSKLENDEKIEIGDIIVFKVDDIKVIHRVIDKEETANETRYYTKGDANQLEDDGYRTRSDIVGKVKCRIPYIGTLTVAINDIFK